MVTIAEVEHVISPQRLDELLHGNRKLFIVDVRNNEEFQQRRIEGRGLPDPIHVQYFELMDADEDDLAAPVATYAKEHWKGRIPSDSLVICVCGKGDTSEFVAEGLRRVGYDAVNLAGGMAAWGDYYAIRLAAEAGAVTVHQVVRPARGCLSYIVASQGEMVVIDPLRHVAQYTTFAQEHGLRIVAVIDTHGHADHISGGARLARDLDVPYYMHPYDAIHPIDVLPATISFRWMGDGFEIPVGATAIRAIHTPGHTLGNMVLLADGRYLFSGDTTFIHSIARPDLGGRGEGWAGLHHESLTRIMKLGDEITVFPGHYSRPQEADAEGLFRATLGELRRGNEGLGMVARGRDAFVHYILSELPEFPEQYVDIKRVNAGLLTPDEEKASELELGRNLCALSGACKESG